MNHPYLNFNNIVIKMYIYFLSKTKCICNYGFDHIFFKKKNGKIYIIFGCIKFYYTPFIFNRLGERGSIKESA